MFSTEKGFIRYLEGKMSPYKLNEKGKSTARQLYSQFSCDLLKDDYSCNIRTAFL